MLNFIRDIAYSDHSKSEDLNEFVKYSKVSTNGFPKNASAIAVGSKQGLIAIGTKDGRIRIISHDGQGWSTFINHRFFITHISFNLRNNLLMVVGYDVSSRAQQFFSCKINGQQLQVDRCEQEFYLKKVTCCELDQTNENWLLIGTIKGNIYRFQADEVKLTEFLVFDDSSLQSFDDLKNDNRHMNKFLNYMADCTKFFLLFDNKFIILYDFLNNQVLDKFVSSKLVTDFCCYKEASYFVMVAAHDDGSYMLCAVNAENEFVELETCSIFGSIPCDTISKIFSGPIISGVEKLLIFSGGCPFEFYEDRNTLVLISGKKFHILDFESSVLDFIVLSEEDSPSSLFILCEDELITVDLLDQNWSLHRLLDFYSFHASPISVIYACANISQNASSLLKTISQEQSQISLYSKKKLFKQSIIEEMSVENEELAFISDIVITGHENGCVNIWSINGSKFIHLVFLNTAKEFEGFISAVPDELLLFRIPCINVDCNESECSSEKTIEAKSRRAEFFDSYSEDPRLSIHKIEFDSLSGYLIIAGKAGQIMVYETLSKTKNVPPPSVFIFDMIDQNPASVSSPSTTNNTNRNKFNRGEVAIAARTSSFEYSPGFILANNLLLQFKPATVTTALTLNRQQMVLAAGNEFGYVIFSFQRRYLLYKNCMLSAADIIYVHGMNGAISKFKSVHKTIRQSFRRTKRPVENTNGPLSIQSNSTLNTLKDYRPNEREILRRPEKSNVLNGETPHSLVKVLTFINCSLGYSSLIGNSDHLFVGNHGGSILVHALTHSRGEIRAELVKEIRFHHGAPIIHISFFVQDLLSSRIIVCSEEQIRILILPSLKPSRLKYRFTAVEGSRIKKAMLLNLRNLKYRNKVEKFLGVITSRGELCIHSLHNPRHFVKNNFTEPNDAVGVHTSTLSSHELFYLKPNGYEIEHFLIGN